MLSDRMKEYIEQLYEQSLKLIESPETVSEAIDKLRMILKVDPDHPGASYNFGKVLLMTGKREEGLEYLEKARQNGYDERIIDSLIASIDIEERPEIPLEEEPQKSMFSKLSSREKIIPLLIFLLISFFSRNFLTSGYLLGWDSMSHVFKTWFAMESLLGRSSLDWCEYWYQGSPIMAMYAPLFYVTSALFGIITRMDALGASKWVVFLSYPTSSLSFYYFTKRDEIDIASIAGSILYGLIPWHFTYITVLGNPTYSLCYVFLPPLFKYLKGHKPRDIILSSIIFSLTTLAHQGTGFLLAYALTWYHLFTGILNRNLRKTLTKLVLIGALSVGLLSFFWIPYLYYSGITSSFQIPFQPAYETVGQLLQRNHFMYLGSPIIFILLAATSTVLISRNREGITFSLLTLLSFIITFGYQDPTISVIYPFVRLIGPGYRFNILTSFTISMVLNIALKETPNIIEKSKRLKINHKQMNQILFIVLIITTALTISAFLSLSKFYNMPITESHTSIYTAISNEEENVRAWWLPRGALETALPMFTGLPTPDGWYDQGADPETVAMIHNLADVQLRENPDYFVEQLAELSVRYLIVSSNQLYAPLKANQNLEILEEYPNIALFRVKNISQISINQKPPSSGLYTLVGISISVLVAVGIINYQYKDRVKGLSITRRNLRNTIIRYWLPLSIFMIFAITQVTTIKGDLHYWPYVTQLYTLMFIIGTYLFFQTSKISEQYPQLEKLLPIAVSVVSMLLAVNVLLTDKIMWTHDTTANSLPFLALYKDIVYSSGQIPRWLHHTWMGVPCLRFYSPIIFWISLIFTTLEPIGTLKMVIYLSFFLSALFMFYLSKEIYPNNTSATISSIVYSINGYHLLDALIRGAIPETFNFVWFPLNFLFYWRILNEKKLRTSIILGGVSMTLIVLTHFLTAYLYAFFLLLLTLGAFVLRKDKKIMINFTAMMIIGISLSAYFTVPFFIENNLARMGSMDIAVQSSYTRTHFVSLGQIFSRRIWEFPNSSPSWSVYFSNVIIFISMLSLIVGRSEHFMKIQKRLATLSFIAILIILYNTNAGRVLSDIFHFYPISIFLEALQFSVRTFTILALICAILTGITIVEGMNLLNRRNRSTNGTIGKIFVVFTMGLMLIDMIPFTGVALWEPKFEPEPSATKIFDKLEDENLPYRIWSPLGPAYVLLNHYSDRVFDTPYLDWILHINKLINEPGKELYGTGPPYVAGYFSIKYIVARLPTYPHFSNESNYVIIESETSDDGTTTVLIENQLHRPFFEVTEDLRDINSTVIESTIESSQLTHNKIEVWLETPRTEIGQQYLTIKESYYPGWTAFVNGEKEKVVPTENGLMAVAIPEGELHIKILFKPTSAENIGLIITVIGTILGAYLAFTSEKPLKIPTLTLGEEEPK